MPQVADAKGEYRGTTRPDDVALNARLAQRPAEAALEPDLPIIDPVFPAQAGMNRPNQNPRPTYARVPRAGGDEPSEAFKRTMMGWCSPRRRG
jgi:hypothetical protein